MYGAAMDAGTSEDPSNGAGPLEAESRKSSYAGMDAKCVVVPGAGSTTGKYNKIIKAKRGTSINRPGTSETESWFNLPL